MISVLNCINRWIVVMYKWILTLLILIGTQLPLHADEGTEIKDEDALKLVIVMEQIKQLYVKDVSYQEIIDNAIKGMLANMDPYSEYMDKESIKQLSKSSTGEFVGVGIEITQEKGEVKVITPIAGSPAEKAGIQPGDFISHVNGKRIQNEKLSDVVSMISGKEGTYVNLAVVTPLSKDIKELKVLRKKINYSSVKGELIDNILYIKVSNFSDSTDADIKTIVEKHKDSSGIIVDVRNNPGGLLQSASKTTDLFLDSKKLSNDILVYTSGRSPYSKLEMKATPNDITNNKPLVVIVNEGSASAAEIFAGALKDHNRAIIVGRKTFGKGSVQTVLPITDDSAVKLTTSLYYTPNGHVIQGNGVSPDIHVPYKEVSQTDEIDPGKIQRLLTEKNFQNSIKTDDSHVKTNEHEHQSNLFQKYAKDDFPLYQSIVILRGLHANSS